MTQDITEFGKQKGKLTKQCIPQGFTIMRNILCESLQIAQEQRAKSSLVTTTASLELHKFV